MNKKPLKARITAVTTAILTMTAMCLPAAAFASSSGVTKEETVYVVTDSSGTQQDVIVSDHLINEDKIKTISDETNLSDVENVKGEETFKQDGDALTWDAEGNGIYYQGKSSDEIPVSMDVVYRLDDKVVSGAELQGKSGKVEIKINYENDAEYEGTTVPFVVMTGLIVTDDSFKNIKISKGKVIDDGEKLLVVGMAAPGLAQTLGIGESDLGIGSSVTITGDADEFAVEDMMTIVTNAFFEDVDTDGIDMDYDDEIDALNKGSKALVDGSDQLYEGLDTLSDNMPDLQDGVKGLKNGSNALESGTNDAKKGAKQLNDGIVKLSSNLEKALTQVLNGVTQLADGSGTLHDGLQQLKSGVDAAKDGSNEVKAGMEQAAGTLGDGVKANEGAKGYIAGAKKAIDGSKKYINGAKQAVSGVSGQIDALHDAGKLSDEEYAQISGTLDNADQALGQADSTLDNGNKALGDASSDEPGTSTAAGVINSSTAAEEGVAGALSINGKLHDGITAVSDGLGTISGRLGDDKTDETLINGASSLNYGLNVIKDSISSNLDSKSELKQGLTALTNGSSKLSKGEVVLAGGAKQLADGMTKLNENTKTMVNGVYQLDNGAYKLRKGMSKLYNEGIQKIVDMYNDDLKGTLDSVDGMLDAGKGYKTFTKLPSGMDGNVKFIYKTDITQ